MRVLKGQNHERWCITDRVVVGAKRRASGREALASNNQAALRARAISDVARRPRAPPARPEPPGAAAGARSALPADSDSLANLGPSTAADGRRAWIRFSHRSRAPFVSRARQAKPVTRPKGPRARSAKSCALRGDNRGRPANAGRSAVRPSRESKIRSPLSLWPPVTWGHGLRLWLKSAASSRLCPSWPVPLVLLLVGESLGR